MANVDPVAEAAVIRDIRKELQQIQFQQIKTVADTNVDLGSATNNEIDSSDNDKENAKESEDKAIESPSTLSDVKTAHVTRYQEVFKSPPPVQTHPAIVDTPLISSLFSGRTNEVIRHFKDPRLVVKPVEIIPTSPNEVEMVSSDDSPKTSLLSVCKTSSSTDNVSGSVTIQTTSSFSSVGQSVAPGFLNETMTELHTVRTTADASTTTRAFPNQSRLTSRLIALFSQRCPDVPPVSTSVTAGSSEIPKTTSLGTTSTVSLLQTTPAQKTMTTSVSTASTTSSVQVAVCSPFSVSNVASSQHVPHTPSQSTSPNEVPRVVHVTQQFNNVPSTSSSMSPSTSPLVSFPSPLSSYSSAYVPISGSGVSTTPMQQQLIQYPPIRLLRGGQVSPLGATTSPARPSVTNQPFLTRGTGSTSFVVSTVNSHCRTSSVLPDVSSLTNVQSTKYGTPLELPSSNVLPGASRVASSSIPSIKNASPSIPIPPAVRRFLLQNTKKVASAAKPCTTPNNPGASWTKPSATLSNVSPVSDTMVSTIVPDTLQIYPNQVQEQSNADDTTVSLRTTALPETPLLASSTSDIPHCVSIETTTSAVTAVNGSSCETSIKKSGKALSKKHLQSHVSSSLIDIPSSTAPPSASAPTGNEDSELTSHSASVSSKTVSPTILSQETTTDRKKTTLSKSFPAQPDKPPESRITPDVVKSMSVIAQSEVISLTESEVNLSKPSADELFSSQVSSVSSDTTLAPVLSLATMARNSAPANSYSVSKQSSDAQQPSHVTCISPGTSSAAIAKCETPSRTEKNVTVFEPVGDQLISPDVPPAPPTTPVVFQAKDGETSPQSCPVENVNCDYSLPPSTTPLLTAAELPIVSFSATSFEDEEHNISVSATKAARCNAKQHSEQALPIPTLSVSNRIPPTRFSLGMRKNIGDSPTLPNSRSEDSNTGGVLQNTPTWFPYPLSTPATHGQPSNVAMLGSFLPNNGWTDHVASFGSLMGVPAIASADSPIFSPLSPTSITFPGSLAQYPGASTSPSNLPTASLPSVQPGNLSSFPCQKSSPKNTSSMQSAMPPVSSPKPVTKVEEISKTTEDSKLSQIHVDLSTSSGFGYTKRFPDVFLNVTGDSKTANSNTAHTSSPQRKATAQTNVESTKRISSPNKNVPLSEMSRDQAKIRAKQEDERSKHSSNSKDTAELDNVSTLANSVKQGMSKDYRNI